DPVGPVGPVTPIGLVTDEIGAKVGPINSGSSALAIK
ncbi:TPA: glutamine synthetase, partial [Bacillus cereus]|nr:glutamine synthetase [Bacillus cereus]